MKITNYAIIFILVFICCIVRIDIKYNNLEIMESKKVAYNNYIDNAVDDAVINLIDYDSTQTDSYNLNRNLCVEKFFKSLYSSFGVLSNTDLKEKINRCIPVITITDYDGFYIYYRDLYKDAEGYTYSKTNWTEKFPYSYDDGNYIYSFTFSTIIKVYDKSTNTIFEGERADAKLQFPHSEILNSDDSFEHYRRFSITDAIQNKLEYYINKYNSIADQFGFKYAFFLPENTHYEIERSIDNIGMFVIFQNYPYGIGTNDVYNRYVYGAARIKKKDSYYLTIDENGEKTYHKYSCHKAKDVTDTCESKKECAAKGYFPCEICDP